MSSNASFSLSPGSSPEPTPPSPVNLSSLGCLEGTVGAYIFAAVLASYFVFFLPLCTLVFHLGLQRRRKHGAASAAATSNLDVFTYNILALELIGMLGSCFFSIGAYTDKSQVELVGVCIYSIIAPGQMLFHSLTSVERYLAVVHPVVFLGLRRAGAVRVRNISIVAVWVVSLGCVVLTPLFDFYVLSTLLTVILILSITVTSFCSFSVFCALIGPRPGEEGGSRDRVDQLKKRSLLAIVVITGVLLLSLGGILLCVLSEATGALSEPDGCLALLFGLSSTVPSSYVMPLLFLHRAGKLRWLKGNAESGRAAEQRG